MGTAQLAFEVVVRGGGATGSDITEIHMTGSDVTEVCSPHTRIFPELCSRTFFGFPRFFLTIVVVQVVQ
jgi:hypothetical protein